MKPDTFAKSIALDALVEAEMGYYLEEPVVAVERFSEGLAGERGKAW